MSETLQRLVALDLPAVLAALLASLSCALLGNFLVLRRASLMGDAISHAVLPGLVLGFLLLGSRSSLPMFIGAAAAGVTTVALVELVRRYARVESGAAMGVVFSVLFALGVVLIRRYADQVDLDADCVLNGSLETIFWSPPAHVAQLLSPGAYFGEHAIVPRQVTTLAVVFVILVGLVSLFYKELRVVTFDAPLAASLGLPASLINSLFMVLVAIAVVASFEAVGSILVIAMLVCPAVAARLLTDRLAPQILASLVIAAVGTAAGYSLAAGAPSLIGIPKALSASGMIVVFMGVVVVGAIFLSPRHGLLIDRARRVRLRDRITREDLLAALFRAEERRQPALRHSELRENLHTTDPRLHKALRAEQARGHVALGTDGYVLTPQGRAAASSIIRSHRLWETYMVDELGLRPDHVHAPAEALEHLRDPITGERVEPVRLPDEQSPAAGQTARDPHDRPIPPASPG